MAHLKSTLIFIANNTFYMKHWFFICLLLPAAIKAQDCNLKKDQDLLTNKPKLSTGFIELDNAILNIEVSGKDIDFFFVIKNKAANCFNDESEVLVTYEGGKLKNEYRNSTGYTNCEGVFHLVFRNSATYTPSGLQKLIAKKAISFLFTASNGKTTLVALNDAQQKLIVQLATCIAKDAKTVL
jgi:hypothetical protein